jgi:hypothetical protein
MKTKIRNSINGLHLIPLVLACFALLPSVQATPDPGAVGGGNSNAADGFGALNATVSGTNNSGFGANALHSLSTGNNNAAQGNSALFSNTSGNKNTALGVLTLRFNQSGNDNTAVGYRAFNNSTGSNNVGVGSGAGRDQTAGSGNTFIGTNAGIIPPDTGTYNNTIFLGNTGDDDANNPDGRCYLGFVRGVETGNDDAITVVIDSDGQLGTISSSRRFKKDIKPMDQTSEAILALKPVTFHYKDGDNKAAVATPQYGLIAEDVAEVNPDLVVRNKEGEIYSVRYDAVNAMLLNEFLKEHRKVQELEATVAQQKKDMEVFAANLKEQAAQIQKVSAQLEVNKSAPRTVANK